MPPACITWMPWKQAQANGWPPSMGAAHAPSGLSPKGLRRGWNAERCCGDEALAAPAQPADVLPGAGLARCHRLCMHSLLERASPGAASREGLRAAALAASG